MEVNHNLVKKMKHHFINLIPDIKAIIGMNGFIWVYYSTINLDSEYFTDDQNKVNALNKHETPNEVAAVNIILFKNIIKSLENNKIFIESQSIVKFYEFYMAHLENSKTEEDNQTELDFFKKNIVISIDAESEVVLKLREFLGSNKAKNMQFKKEIKDLNKMMVDEESADEN